MGWTDGQEIKREYLIVVRDMVSHRMLISDKDKWNIVENEDNVVSRPYGRRKYV